MTQQADAGGAAGKNCAVLSVTASPREDKVFRFFLEGNIPKTKINVSRRGAEALRCGENQNQDIVAPACEKPLQGLVVFSAPLRENITFTVQPNISDTRIAGQVWP